MEETERELDKWEILIIRASKQCGYKIPKSNFDLLAQNAEGIRRLRRIWCMRCGPTLRDGIMKGRYDNNIVYAMFGILEKRKCGMSNTGDGHLHVIDSLNPEQAWKSGITEDMGYFEKLIRVLDGMIATSRIDEWPNFRSPLKFRKKQAA